ncbi:RimJ/RimL family protein N-acetyltransferase [Haloactinospora alba]|uniref:RimJ/RimL family protein N-acetyltransferase n=1 Tax=Haloactinospora alba TaxID=405555 RepID=A0A543NJA8_9ACTN|nr:GNAT family N-acetyltransferase [Haloactinospora alba]TQN31899.1 RimJ/RimL family protein N-acetyltransferase [Haloactinospora alba]
MLALPITTERLLLRVPQATDLDPLREFYEDPAALEHVGTQTAWDRESMGRRLQGWADDHQQHGYGMATIELRGNRDVIGLLGLSPGEDGIPELSCMLIRAYWRSGYCREAAAAYLARAQHDPRFSAIRVRMESHNPARAHMERHVFFPHGFACTAEEPFPPSGRLMRYYSWTAPPTR